MIPRTRRRPGAARGTALRRRPGRSVVHRRIDARRRTAGRRRPQRPGQRDGRRPRRGNAAGRGGRGAGRGRTTTRSAQSERTASTPTSIKLTGFGLHLDHDLCRLLVARSRMRARRTSSSGSTWRTPRRRTRPRPVPLTPRQLWTTSASSCSRARRTLSDIEDLRELQSSVRLRDRRAVVGRFPGVRGDPQQLRFVPRRAARGGMPAAVATHDEWLLEQALERVEGVDERSYELQMLPRGPAGARPRARRRRHLMRSIRALRGAVGTSTRCGGCRRTRRSRATSPGTCSGASPGRRG